MFRQLHKLHGAVVILPVPDPDVKLRILCQINISHDVPVAGVDVAGKEQFANLLSPWHCTSCLCKKVLLLIPAGRVGLIPVCESVVRMQQDMVMPPLLCLQCTSSSQS